MVAYVYRVEVKTDTGTSISDSVEKLTKAQDTAATIFKEMSEKLDGEKLIENILESLSNKLDSFEGGTGKIDLKEQLNPISDTLKEIQAALLVLLGVKEGSVIDTFNAFDQAQKAIGKEGSLSNMLQNLFIEFNKNYENKMTDIFTDMLSFYRTLNPTVSNVEGEFINPSSDQIFNERFLKRSIGDLSGFFENYESDLLDSILNEFRNFFSGDTTPGKIFTEFGLEKDDDYQEINQQLKNRLDALRTMRAYEDDPKRSQFGHPYRMAQYDLESAENILNDDKIWIRLNKKLEESILLSLSENATGLLSDESVMKLIKEEILNPIIKSTKEDLLKESENLSRPGSARSIAQSVNSMIIRDENLDLDKIIGSIDQKDFEINKSELTNKINDVMAQANERFQNTSSSKDSTLNEFLLDEFSKAGFDEALFLPLSNYIIEQLQESEKPLMEEGEKIRKNLFKTSEGEFFISKTEGMLKDFSKLSNDLQGMLNEYNDMWNEKAKQFEEMENQVSEKSENIEDFNLEEYFIEAIDHRQNLHDMLYNGIIQILNSIDEMSVGIDGHINIVRDEISNIEIPKPERVAGSASQLFPVGG